MDKIILWEIQEFQIFKIQLDAIHNSSRKQSDTERLKMKGMIQDKLIQS